MKALLLIIALHVSGLSFAQELNIGLDFTGGPEPAEARIVAMGPTIEFRPVKSIVSINSGVIFLVYKKEALVSFPLSLKFIIGNTVRFCPSIGGFVRSNSNSGFSAGATLDYKIVKGLFLYLKGEYNHDFWKDEVPDHFGGTYEIINHGPSYWFGVGIKKNVL